MRANQNFILKEIAGEFILLPTGNMAAKFAGIIDLNESGVLLWNRLRSDCSEQELIDVLLDEYDIDEQTAEQDVRIFLARMREADLLID